MECTTGFQELVSEWSFPVTELVFDDPIAFDAPDGVFDANADA